MKFGIRRPSLRRRIGARTSWKRYVRHSLGVKAPRGYGWITNPKKAAYNRIYNRTTMRLGRGCLVVLVVPFLALVGLVLVFEGWPVGAAQSAQSLHPPDVPFQAAPKEVVIAMLSLAKVTRDDVVFDLGCGDGRIVIAAAQLYGSRGVGIDIDPQRVNESVANATREGVLDRVVFRNEDLFTSDIHAATVVTLFLWPKVNLRVRPKLLRDLKPGTRVVSYLWDMGDWAPDATVRVNGDPIYLWTVRRGSRHEERIGVLDGADTSAHALTLDR